MHIRVMTTDGILETLTYCERDEWVEFSEYVATYIDTEGSAGRTGGGYVVQLIDDDGNVIAEETQESY